MRIPSNIAQLWRSKEVQPPTPARKLTPELRQKEPETPEKEHHRKNRQLFDAMVSEYLYTTRAIPGSRTLLMSRTHDDFSVLRNDPQFDERERHEIDLIFDRWIILHRARENMENILRLQEEGKTGTSSSVDRLA